MKAFVLEKYGHPMREVSMAEPTAGPRQVLVRMVAAGVNHADERTRAGELKAVFRLDLPHVMGGELSDDVEATRRMWARALAPSTVQGLVLGRSMLYPADGDVASAVDNAVTLLEV